MNEIIRNEFLRMMKGAFYDAKSAYECVIGNEHKKPDKCMALSYASTSLTKCYSAMALYYSKLDMLEHLGLSELFHQFDVFVTEIQSDYETKHSTQWVNIEFERLNDLFECSVCTQPIIE